VARDLKRIDTDQTARILRKIDEELPDKADSFPVLSGKFSGLRKFRVGDYRVIYSIIGDTALILRISHRREAYRK
jgi:mRNA interferase RelE/StbE